MTDKQNAAIQLIQGWLDDDSGVWPGLRRLIEEEHEEDVELCQSCQVDPSPGRHACMWEMERERNMDDDHCNCCAACAERCADDV